MKMFEYSSYQAENKSQYLSPKWQLKYYDLDLYSLKVKVILIKMELKFTNIFPLWGI